MASRPCPERLIETRNSSKIDQPNFLIWARSMWKGKVQGELVEPRGDSEMVS